MCAEFVSAKLIWSSSAPAMMGVHGQDGPVEHAQRLEGVVKRTLIGFIGLMAAVGFALPNSAGAVTPEGMPMHRLADLSAEVDHPFVPLTSVPSKTFTGEEIDPETGKKIALRIEETVLTQSEQVSGVQVTIVKVDDYYDGELGKTTEDYFAQAPDGTVYYLGERVDEFQDGQVVGHEGAWLAEPNGNPPGLFMPPAPTVGQTFNQEQIPGVAEAQSKVVAVDQTVTSASGTFAGCIQTEDRELLEEVVEQKYYCPGVGLVREEFPGGHIDLVEFETKPAQ
jgi:hypothetical protein